MNSRVTQRWPGSQCTDAREQFVTLRCIEYFQDSDLFEGKFITPLDRYRYGLLEEGTLA